MILVGILLCSITVWASSEEDSDEFYHCVSIEHINYHNTKDNPLYRASGYIRESNESFKCLQIKDSIDGYPVDAIEGHAFYGCPASEIIIPTSVKYILGSAFKYSSIKELTVPESVSYVDNWVAENCTYLKTLNWNTPLAKCIPTGAFASCTRLKQVNLSKGVEDIMDSAFVSCTSLEKIVLPETVKSIRDYSFSGCSSLKEIYIPTSVKNISGSAFSGDKKLVIKGNANSYAEYYAKANGIPFKEVGSAQKPITNRPLIKSAQVSGNTLKVSLFNKVPQATYTYYVMAYIYDLADKKEFDDCSVRKVRTSKTAVTMYNMPKGQYRIYCKSERNGKIGWSNDLWFTIKNQPVNTPVVKNVSVKGNTITVTMAVPKKSKGYDCILAKDWDGLPHEAAYTLKNQTAQKIVFKNVKPGTYYVTAHAFVREKINSGKKVFGDWAKYKKIIVK